MPNWSLLGATILPNIGGWMGALTMHGQVKNTENKAWYQTLKKPNWNPPNWIFAPTWTTLYAGMGYASYLIYRDCNGFTDESILPLTLYGGQLLLNWTWTPIFFRFHHIGLALANIVALDVAVVATIWQFHQINKNAGYLMIPYLMWISFATCLNYAIWTKNSSTSIEEIKDD